VVNVHHANPLDVSPPANETAAVSPEGEGQRTKTAGESLTGQDAFLGATRTYDFPILGTHMNSRQKRARGQRGLI